MTKVFVLDHAGTPLLPTHPARARKLLNSGKAIVERVVPFTIRLLRMVHHPAGSFSVGIDDGAKRVGIAAVNNQTQEIVFQGIIRLRQDVHKKMLQRAHYRRNRRNRKLRHRKRRFLNRGKKGWISPTIRQKKDSVLRVLSDLQQLIPISRVVIELGQFDTSSLAAGRQLHGMEYLIPDYEGKSFRAKVLWRDRYTCQKCGSQERLHAHHIRPQTQGGTNTPQNGITFCKTCHEALHRGEWELTKSPSHFVYPAHAQVGKKYIFQAIEDLGITVQRCLGWMTAYWRKQMGLEKTHVHDAVAMVCRGEIPKKLGKEYLILPRRKKIWETNPTKTCIEKHGFRHFDLVKARHRNRGVVIGSIRSLKARAIALRTKWSGNFLVSYNKSRLLYRCGAIVYI